MIGVLVGPTAAGKTRLALDLARRFAAIGRPAEILNADSMLLYRGMDIGTAKPTAAERAEVPHHLIDVLDVTETASVAQFQASARAMIEDCQRRDVVPLVVGGSALYVRAVVDRFEFPGTDPVLRAELEQELDRRGAAALQARLAGQDPTAAARIGPTNGRRLVRALEVVALTGRPFTASLPGHEYALPDVRAVGLTGDRAESDQRIEQRVRAMWRQGFVEEVRELVPRGLREGRTASRALGYRQILDFLDGRCTEAEAQASTVAATRRFSRRQMSWFDRDPRITWVPATDPDRTERAATLLTAPADAAVGH